MMKLLGRITIRCTKTLKNLWKFKKTNLLNSKIDDLIKHKGNHEFWSYLKSLNETDKSVSNGMLEARINKLYDHFEKLHSKPKPSILSKFHLSVLNDKSALEQQKDDQNYLDDGPCFSRWNWNYNKTFKIWKSSWVLTENEMKCSKPALGLTSSLQSANYITISSPLGTFHKVVARV